MIEQENTKPLFEVGKQYRFRSGEIVTVSSIGPVRIDADWNFPIETMGENGLHYHRLNGKNCDDYADFDLIPGAVAGSSATAPGMRSE